MASESSNTTRVDLVELVELVELVTWSSWSSWSSWPAGFNARAFYSLMSGALVKLMTWSLPAG